jgi:hypothetical protein
MIEFIFPNRLHRLAYLWRLLAANFVTCFLYSCSTTMNPTLWWALAIALALYSLFFIVMARIRDIGISKWWLLATFVPVVDIIFGIILLLRAPASLSHRPGAVPAPV